MERKDGATLRGSNIMLIDLIPLATARGIYFTVSGCIFQHNETCIYLHIAADDEYEQCQRMEKPEAVS